MQHHAGRRRAVGIALALLVALAASPAASAAYDPAEAPPIAELLERTHDRPPLDRYEPAGGCYAVRTTDGDAPVAHASAGPFHFQAIDLGRYLLRGPEGWLSSTPDGLEHATAPGPAAELELLGTGPAHFHLRTSDGRHLTGGPELRSEPTDLSLVPADGCPTPPDAELNLEGPVATGSSPNGPVVGYLDSHLHMTAFEFLGGTVHCGRPWHPYGVEHALADCPDHTAADGNAAVIENLFATGTPLGDHDPVGWPTFEDWPAPLSLTHEQTYHRWLERAWRGGVRMVINLFVENRVLCEVYPLKKNPCDEMASVRLQAQRLHELERYIDAQWGGPGRGWFRIVTDPETARRTINEGRMAVVPGMEVSEAFGCRLSLGVPQCDPSSIDRSLDELHALGVRQLNLVHKFDNALGGTIGDGAALGLIINGGNFLGTGSFWSFEQCDADDTGEHDRDQITTVPELGEATQLLTGLLGELSPAAAVPLYPPGHHCNVRGVSELGHHVLDRMIDRGMVVDVDHMGLRSRDEALDQLEAVGYGGVISSHSFATQSTWERVLALGGVVGPYAGDADGFVDAWHRVREARGTDGTLGLGFGADTNGLATQGNPRGGPTGVTYPFTGLGGVTLDRQRTGERVFDVNTDGVAHYGLYPDWIEDLRVQAGDEIVADLAQGAEAYLQMWARAEAFAGDVGASPVPSPASPEPTLPATGGTGGRAHPWLLAVAAAGLALLRATRRPFER
ncbi:MAG: dipeptidase [Actinomycetota bacterium]|nr:dipeptidase [Actinomycetota bacterium]